MKKKMELHHHIKHHIQKHHKKYLFAGGVAMGRGVFKIVIVIAVFFGITALGAQPNVYAAKMEVYQAVTSFYQIDDIAHQEVTETIEEGNPFTEEKIKEFTIIDTAFHNATDIHEQFRAAKKMVDFLMKLEETHPNLGKTDPDIQRDQKFAELLAVFNRIN